MLPLALPVTYSTMLVKLVPLNLRNDFIFLVRFEAFTPVTMKNGVFSDVTPCDSCKNRRFGRTSRHASVANYGYVPSSPILVALMKEA
jgi:hypothetical protein